MKLLNKYLEFAVFLMLSSGLITCSSAGSNENAVAKIDWDKFADYWYAGKAEITRYALEQARYGEIRKGEAVLIFVTENFLTDKQVKHEFGESENATTVLKLNFVRKFYTGIYPYSMMSSIFTPVDVSRWPTLKVTTTSQEWCGHTFTQFNHRDDKYKVQLRSYFQREGDQDFEVKSTLLEDEIWTKIRLAPNSLPTGEIEIIPGTQFSRFRHTELKPEKATAALKTEKDQSLSSTELQVYTIDYETLERKLVIRFEKELPFKIVAWEEHHTSGYGPGAEVMTTRAVKTHSVYTDYWTKNKKSDSHWREKLGLIY
ncbi:hypothetical protein GWO43_27035 [candidate division KSB1 bacterium]|nr:hypothetical protein [candidate division KSB1 bacterium]NIR70308.1 hypothetical protein [candidate division KSB1 bacterium]NIS27612.1 hypothetical protein [candidate division KSB1 bacterium]NIT74452.1 hypothetical protein [candidate division KSB1 bacterium]NIU28977.1 hypothetical protein [candidate division KSB1 bacterium]